MSQRAISTRPPETVVDAALWPGGKLSREPIAKKAAVFAGAAEIGPALKAKLG